MIKEEQQFAGWQRDQKGPDTSRPRLMMRIGGGVFLLGFVLALACTVLSLGVHGLNYLRWVSIGLVLMAIGGFGVKHVFHERMTALQTACPGCGKSMKLAETLPPPGNGQPAGELVVRDSGRAYRLVRLPGDAVKTYEVARQWLTCEPCKRYRLLVSERRTEIGDGPDAIERQEATYKQSAKNRERLAERAKDALKKERSRPPAGRKPRAPAAEKPAPAVPAPEPSVPAAPPSAPPVAAPSAPAAPPANP